MKNIILALTLSFSLLLAACGGSSGGNGGGGRVSVNGKNPRDYFNQFLYHNEGECDKGSIYFYYLGADDVVLETKADGTPARMSELKVALINNDTYYYRYEEREIISSDGTRRQSTPVYEEEDYGKYKISAEGKLVLDKWGIGSALTYNDVDVVSFQFTNKERLHLKGKETILSMWNSTLGLVPGKKYYEDVCKNQKDKSSSKTE